MAEQLLTLSDIKEDELHKMNLVKSSEEIGATLLANSCSFNIETRAFDITVQI